MERTYVNELWNELLSLPRKELEELEIELFESYFFSKGSREDWIIVGEAVRWNDREDDYYR